MIIDTRGILEKVDIEKMSQEEIQDVQASLGKYQALVQQSRLEIHKNNSDVLIYRIILISRFNNDERESSMFQIIKTRSSFNHHIMDHNEDGDIITPKVGGGQTNLNIGDTGGIGYEKNIQSHEASSQISFNNSQSSTASTQKSNTFQNTLKDFKKSMGEKQTARNITLLNRIVISILCILIILQGIDYMILKKTVINQQNQNMIMLNGQRRIYLTLQLSTNTKTLLAIANEDIYPYYELWILNRYQTRPDLLEGLIQQQGVQLQSLETFLVQQRASDYQDVEQTDMEKQDINLYIYSPQGTVYVDSMHFRVAFDKYLEDIQAINGSNYSELQLLPSVFLSEPQNTLSSIYPNLGDSMSLSAYNVAVNGIRTIRIACQNAAENMVQLYTSLYPTINQPFLIIMIVSSVIIAISISMVYYQIWQIESVQDEILSMYTQLNRQQIREVYQRCNEYMATLNQGSLIEQMVDQQEQKSTDHRGTATATFNMFDRNTISSENSAKHVGGKRPKQMKQLNLYQSIIKQTLREVKELSKIGILLDYDESNSQERAIEEEAKVVSERDKRKSKRASKMEKKFSLSKGKGEVEEEVKSDSFSESDPRDGKKQKKAKKSKKGDKQKVHEQGAMQEELDQQKSEDYKSFTDRAIIKNVGRKVLCLLIGIVILSYFIQVYIYQIYYMSQLSVLQSTYPVFQNRFFYLLMFISLARERLFYNNSLASFEKDPEYGYNLDSLYYQMSVQNEQNILSLKQSHPPILSSIMSFMDELDSKDLCGKLVSQSINEYITQDFQVNTIAYNQARFNPYYQQLYTVITPCQAAYLGDQTTLTSYQQDQDNFNEADLDGRTPLHYAVKAGEIETVNFLLQNGAEVTAMDRWGLTPINYAMNNSDIISAILGVQPLLNATQVNITSIRWNLTDNDVRLFYAAQNGDLPTAQYLIALGQNYNVLDIDKRSPLHVASCSGQLFMVQYLISVGADPTLFDTHGNDATLDASRSGSTLVLQYLDSTIASTIIREQCSNFYMGLYATGMKDAMGVYHKKYQDFIIKIANAASPNQAKTLVGFVRGPQFVNGTFMYTPGVENFSLNQIFFMAQELFNWRMYDLVSDTIASTFTSFTASYLSNTETIFIVFILTQICTLVVLRGRMTERMRADIIESRGVLNLIPNRIIEQNKGAVESIINKLKS